VGDVAQEEPMLTQPLAMWSQDPQHADLIFLSPNIGTLRPVGYSSVLDNFGTLPLLGIMDARHSILITASASF